MYSTIRIVDFFDFHLVYPSTQMHLPLKISSSVFLLADPFVALSRISWIVFMNRVFLA
ncbi:hypothetical protein L8106_21467 [Lyngbya sp. PCC 8106]|nr:hypothetical protein L8106_21467 [Lyngbya sp. PCC 8106]